MGDSSRLTRDSEFAYTCNGCMSCCRGAHIALDPYEISRLARNRNLSTTEFISRYLTEGGIVLRNREDTSCTMLGANGCTAYADRPQICRTYPLKRLRSGDTEVLHQYSPLPGSTGVYANGGTVSDFLKTHEVGDLFAAKDRYFALALRIAAVLAEAVKREPDRFATMRDTIGAHSEFRTEAIPALIDVDRVVSDYCRQRQLGFPAALDERIALHIEAIEERLATISPGQSAEIDDQDAGDQLKELAALSGALGAAVEARVLLAFIDGIFGGRESKAPQDA